MKFQKLFVSVATACLLVGVSSAAMAQEEPPPAAPVVDTCEKGAIIATIVDEIVVTGRSCFISDVAVEGNVTATNSQTFTITSSKVGGTISVTGSENATLLTNEVFDGDIAVQQNMRAIVSANRVESITAGGGGGNILVDQHTNAQVDRNIADGDITCTNNADLDSFFNLARGTLACP
jgi:hypothetical protein